MTTEIHLPVKAGDRVYAQAVYISADRQLRFAPPVYGIVARVDPDPQWPDRAAMDQVTLQTTSGSLRTFARFAVEAA